MLSVCARYDDIKTDVRRDAESYAIAACLANQKHPYLKEQGDAWAGEVVQGSQLTIEAMAEISEVVRQEIAKGGMPVAYSELGDERDRTMPILYCVEITENSLVRASIENAISVTERWLNIGK